MSDLSFIQLVSIVWECNSAWASYVEDEGGWELKAKENRSEDRVYWEGFLFGGKFWWVGCGLWGVCEWKCWEVEGGVVWNVF